jgi:2,4-dienoyl-CoA reductase-like NADH-dependent reductase (Old Yellow Enzyme family)
MDATIARGDCDATSVARAMIADPLLQQTLDPTADIPDNFDAVAARYAAAAPRYRMQFLTE